MTEDILRENNIMLVENLHIDAFGTVDIISHFNLNIFLTINSDANLLGRLGKQPELPDMTGKTITDVTVSNQLQCWSAGTTQPFDCDLTFMAVADTSVTI